MSIGRPPGPIEPPPPPPLTVEPQVDGSLVLVSTETEDDPAPAGIAVPRPPAVGTFTLMCFDGVLVWQPTTIEKTTTPPAVKAAARKAKE